MAIRRAHSDDLPAPGARRRQRSGVEALELFPTGWGPAPPGVRRRATGRPGSSSATPSDPRSGCASTNSASGTRRSRLSRTARPPVRARPGTACPGPPAARQGRWRPRTASRPPAACDPDRTPGSREARHRGQCQRELFDGVEQRLLVLLQVAVVAERQPLQRRQHPREVADQPAGLAPGQLGDVGVLLLRQHRRSGGIGVVEPNEPELVGRPQDHLLAHARQVHRRAG